MSDGPTEELVASAAAGNRTALDELLLVNYEPVTAHISRRLSSQYRNLIAVEDIVQQTFVHAIRDIRQFRPRSNGAFLSWLKRIAENRTMDAIRRLSREKNVVRTEVRPHANCECDSPVRDLVELLSTGSNTPSRSAARHEAVAAIRHSLETLPQDYRQAVELRLLAGKSLQETATIMNRSDRAVQGLIDRAKKKMRAALGRLSLYE